MGDWDSSEDTHGAPGTPGMFADVPGVLDALMSLLLTPGHGVLHVDPVQSWTCWRSRMHEGVRVHPVFGWPQCTVCGAAPSYDERTMYARALGVSLDIVVPTGESTVPFALGSAAVTLPTSPSTDQRVVYYEGWVYDGAAGQDVGSAWLLGLRQAVARAVTSYPTTAVARVPERSLTVVGEYRLLPDPAGEPEIVTITNAAPLNAWLGLRER